MAKSRYGRKHGKKARRKGIKRGGRMTKARYRKIVKRLGKAGAHRFVFGSRGHAKKRRKSGRRRSARR